MEPGMRHTDQLIVHLSQVNVLQLSTPWAKMDSSTLKILNKNMMTMETFSKKETLQTDGQNNSTQRKKKVHLVSNFQFGNQFMDHMMFWLLITTTT